ncbi:hypothetical protein RRG08_005048 [Elysia crispata]|uniref:Uncharacterized protein n=1 Tax=Elysia crispata TaxID=231223 RepID=A0AAE1CPR2_9GAST|nr:hypothetical protein RRG08_005048 [Elysia crispata]
MEEGGYLNYSWGSTFKSHSGLRLALVSNVLESSSSWSDSAITKWLLIQYGQRIRHIILELSKGCEQSSLHAFYFDRGKFESSTSAELSGSLCSGDMF